MKNLTIALSLILNLGLFGCHDKDYSPTSFNETESVTPDRPSDTAHPFTFVCGGVSFEDGVTEDSGDVFCTYPDDPPGQNPPGQNPVTPEPVTPEQVTPESSNDRTPFRWAQCPIGCRSVSSWDGVTEESGDVFCEPEPTRPSSPEPLIGCAGTVTSQAQVDSVRDCTALYGSIDFESSAITVINLPLLEHITGKVLLEDNYRLTDLLLPALTSIEGVFIFRCNGVTEMSLPSLKRIGGHVEIIKSHGLMSFVIAV